MTAAEISAELVVLKEAYLRLASGVSSYTINLGGTSRTVMRMNLVQLRKEIEYKEAQLEIVSNSGSSGLFGLPTKYGTRADER